MKRPIYILSAIPKENIKLKNIFEFGKNSVQELLENPGQLRPMGWDLNTKDNARIEKGEFLEVRNGERKLIRLYEDGTLILFAAADETFLGWGPRDLPFNEDARLNVLAITELTYNFVDFYTKLIQFFTSVPQEISFRMKLKDAFLDNSHKLYIIPREVNTMEYEIPFKKCEAKSSEIEEIISVKREELLDSPQYIAYRLIRKMYFLFNIPENEIPYTLKDKKDRRVIDVEKIKKA